MELSTNDNGMFCSNCSVKVVFNGDKWVVAAAVSLGCVFVTVGIIGNGITILALLFSPRLKNATTPFLLNLCISDFLYCVFPVPLELATIWNGTWRYGYTVCVSHILLTFVFTGISIFTMTAIAVNRYILIVHPSKFHYISSWKGIAAGLAAIHLLVWFPMLLSLFRVWGQLGFDSSVGFCDVLLLDGTSPKTMIYVVSFAAPTVSYAFCYSRIYWVTVISRKKAHCDKEAPNLQPDRKSCFTSALRTVKGAVFPNSTLKRSPANLWSDFHLLRMILIVFLLYIFGHVVPMLLVNIYKDHIDVVYRIFGYSVKHLTKSINPIVYVAMSRPYRRAYEDVFTCCKGTVAVMRRKTSDKRQPVSNSQDLSS